MLTVANRVDAKLTVRVGWPLFCERGCAWAYSRRQVSWFRKHKLLNETASGGCKRRRRFEVTTYSEKERELEEHSEHHVDEYITFDWYAVKKAAMGASPAQIKQMWKDDLSNPAIPRQKHGDVFLLYDFKGIRQETGHRKQQER